MKSCGEYGTVRLVTEDNTIWSVKGVICMLES